MTRNLPTLLSNIILVSVLLFSHKLKAQCSGHSVVVEDITITSMTTTDINYNYTIRNTGSTTVSTDNLIVQNYLSTDESIGGDAAAGGGFIMGSVTLNPNDTYDGSFSSSVNYPTYPYLRLNLQYAILSTCQVTVDDEFACLRPDAEISNFNITNTQSNSITYHFDLQNTGGDTLFFNQLLLENFLSVDNTYDGSDVSAGSTNVTIPSVTYLRANELNTVNYTTTGSINGYNYLIVKLTYSEQSECATGNNEMVVSIPPVSGLFSSSKTEANSIVWDMDTKSFTFDNADLPKGSSLEYRLYNSAGVVLISGNVIEGEPTSLKVPHGFYVLVISNGERNYLKRIIY